jgi:hypothetical protein
MVGEGQAGVMVAVAAPLEMVVVVAAVCAPVGTAAAQARLHQLVPSTLLMRAHRHQPLLLLLLLLSLRQEASMAAAAAVVSCGGAGSLLLPCLPRLQWQ